MITYVVTFDIILIAMEEESYVIIIAKPRDFYSILCTYDNNMYFLSLLTKIYCLAAGIKINS